MAKHLIKDVTFEIIADDNSQGNKSIVLISAVDIQRCKLGQL